MTLDPTVTAASIAALVATAGYLVTQRAQRRERRSRIYAEALRAVRDLQETPYLIWRRGDDSPEALRQIGGVQSERFAAVHYYSQLLGIETPWVGEVYRALQRRVRRQTAANARVAWDRQPMAAGAPWTDSGFVDDAQPELALCIAAMQADVAGWAVARRRQIQRRLRELNVSRPLPPWPGNQPAP